MPGSAVVVDGLGQGAVGGHPGGDVAGQQDGSAYERVVEGDAGGGDADEAGVFCRGEVVEGGAEPGGGAGEGVEGVGVEGVTGVSRSW
ncbi:hypothetical protein GCM10022248_85110 [Nonomuraea soli]